MATTALVPYQRPYLSTQRKGRGATGPFRNVNVGPSSILDDFLSRIPGRTAGAIRNYLGGQIHAAGMAELKLTYGLSKIDPKNPMTKVVKGLGLGYLGYRAVSGYREGGIAGAAGNVAMGAAENYAFGAALKILGLTSGGLLAGGAAAGTIAGGLLSMEAARQGTSVGAMMSRPYVREHMKRRAKLEMGSPIQDSVGMVSTMRQRGIQAMRQSKITARSALGMESSRRYIPYLR